jgi:hypothetical protein
MWITFILSTPERLSHEKSFQTDINSKDAFEKEKRRLITLPVIKVSKLPTMPQNKKDMGIGDLQLKH